jgi:hypothetical protein
VSITLGHRSLDFQGAAHGIDRAGKLDESAIARRLDDAAPMLRNLRIDDFVPGRLERRESAFLINPHKPALADDIARENGGQPPFYPRLGHDRLNPGSNRFYGRESGVSIDAMMSDMGATRRRRVMSVRCPLSLRSLPNC